jgi:hypothetical protein
MLMMWRSHIEEVLDILIDKTKMRTKEVGDVTLERPNASFVASFDNILAVLIIAFQRPFVGLYHFIKKHPSIYNYL